MTSPAPRPSITAFVEAGVALWPSLRIDREAFAQHLSAIAPPSLDHAGDVALTFACAARVQEAVSALDPILRSAVARAVTKLDASPAFADDVAQKLRESLLLSAPPKIATYAGRAPLHAWLRMASLRTALNLRRRREDGARARATVEELCDLAAPDADLSYLRARYKNEFAAALTAAVAGLPPKDRRILRSYVIDRSTLETLAASHGVGLSTISRWLKAIRKRLTDDTKARLRRDLKLTSSEYEGIAALVRSDMDVSVAGLLRSR